MDKMFANTFIYFRKKAHLTQSELALAMGIAQSEISKIEEGTHLPKIPTIAKAAFIAILIIVLIIFILLYLNTMITRIQIQMSVCNTNDTILGISFNSEMIKEFL